MRSLDEIQNLIDYSDLPLRHVKQVYQTLIYYESIATASMEEAIILYNTEDQSKARLTLEQMQDYRNQLIDKYPELFL